MNKREVEGNRRRKGADGRVRSIRREGEDEVGRSIRRGGEGMDYKRERGRMGLGRVEV